MKHNYIQSTLFIFFCLLASATAFAYDAYDAKIDGIYYNFSGDEATVTYQRYNDSYPHYSSDYSGAVVIPSSVTYNGTTYSVTSIGEYAFSYCSSLTSINIPDGVTSIGHQAFTYCSSLTSINIPEGVASIGESVFNTCSHLTSITLPASVTSIGTLAFYNCSSLTSIAIPEGVTSIGWSAFGWCNGLTSIKIPKGVTSIGHYAFEYCYSLTEVYCLAKEVPETSSYAFGYSDDSPIASATLYVPAGSMEAYKTTEPWSGFGTIVGLTDDEIDGISLTPALSKGEGAIYNLSGQHLNKMQKGINIVNGKKILK